MPVKLGELVSITTRLIPERLARAFDIRTASDDDGGDGTVLAAHCKPDRAAGGLRARGVAGQRSADRDCGTAASDGVAGSGLGAAPTSSEGGSAALLLQEHHARAVAAAAAAQQQAAYQYAAQPQLLQLYGGQHSGGAAHHSAATAAVAAAMGLSVGAVPGGRVLHCTALCCAVQS